MNATDYFININAMFLFCIFTCGLLLAVGWKLSRKSDKLKKEQDSHLKATKINSLLTKENKEIDDKLAQAEHKLRYAEKEVRELQAKLDHAEADRIELRAERATLENKLTDALAKVRKRDKDGKFLPSGNARVRTPKKLKLVTDLGENDVIHCKTAKERLAIRTLMHEAGLKWATGHSYMEKEYFYDYRENLYYRPKSGTHGDIDMIEESMTTIHPASDFIARPKRVKRVSLKVSTDITAVEDAVDSVYNVLTKIKAVSDAKRAFDEMMSNPIEQLDGLTVKPKLIHGLTVKNPTDDEAKMIFDEAMRLEKLSANGCHKITESLPSVWYFEGGSGKYNGVGACVTNIDESQTFVTAKEFVQRMQNGRG